MYKKREAIAIAGKTKPTRGTKIEGKNETAIIFYYNRKIKKIYFKKLSSFRVLDPLLKINF